jgi:hypothetical protein
MPSEMRPFDPAPDLLAEAQACADFMSQGMPGFARLIAAFNLQEDNEGSLQLGIALQAYAKGDMALAGKTLLEFAAVEARLPVLGRVFEVLYKAVSAEIHGATVNWVSFAIALYQRHPNNPEMQRLVLEFFTYFGLWNHALTVHVQLPAKSFEPWRSHIMLRRALAEGFQPKYHFSFILLTWNRADLLDRCLAEIRAKAGSDDYEIIVGVNASSDHTAQVLEKHGVSQVHWNARNDSIDYYRKVFDAARGATIIEIDDNVVEMPDAFDLVLETHLKTFPEYGYLGFQPTRLDSASGTRAIMEAAPDSQYQRVERAGLVIHPGPVWGCCAAIAKRDWLDFGGFYGLRMSKTLGEEPQIIRKLRLRDRRAALIRGETLLKVY